MDSIASVLSNQADATLEVHAVMSYMLKTNAIDGIKVVAQNFIDVHPLHILVQKNFDTLTSIINKAMLEVDKDEQNKIAEKWIEIHYQNFADTRLLIQMSIGFFIIVFFVIYRQIILTRTNDILSKARDEADRANKSKSDFLASMSHEIRTPMSGIIGFSELLEKTDLNKTQKEYVDIINSSSNILLGIINDILDMSKIENNSLNLINEPFNLSKDIQNLLKLYEAQCISKNITLKLQSNLSANHCIYGDSLRLKQIIANLLSNAVKFTPEHGTIDLEVKSTRTSDNSEDIYIAVKDSGIGFDKPTKEKIFQPFMQASDYTSHTHGGTGLGLSIVTKLVELMDGKIDAHSKPNKGSSFFFNFSTTTCKLEETTKEIDEETETKPLNILIAEDNKTNQIFIGIILKKLNHKATFAFNGKEAFEEYTKNSYDLILMDINMPVMDGVESTKKIRIYENKHQLKQITIIALTANAFESDKRNYLESGMQSVLSKPVNTEELKKVLDNI